MRNFDRRFKLALGQIQHFTQYIIISFNPSLGIDELDDEDAICLYDCHIDADVIGWSSIIA